MNQQIWDYVNDPKKHHLIKSSPYVSNGVEYTFSGIPHRILIVYIKVDKTININPDLSGVTIPSTWPLFPSPW